MSSILSHIQLKEASASLEEMTKYQDAVQTRLMDEKTKLKEQMDAQVQSFQREQNTQAELQAALMRMKSANTQLSQQLASEEGHRKDLQKSSTELQAKLTAVQEEHAALVQQLQLERDVHQKELKSIKCTLRLCQQERDSTQAHVSKLKVASLIHGPLFVLINKGRADLGAVAKTKTGNFV